MPKDTYEKLEIKSVNSVIYDTPELTIGKIARLVSRTAAQAIISIALNEVAEALNVGKTINPTQMKMIAEYIIDDFSYLKPSEIKYCFHRGIFQGEIYNKLDCNIIGKWIRSYDMLRNDEISSNNLSQEQKEKGIIDGLNGYKTYIDILTKKADEGDAEAKERLQKWIRAEQRIRYKDKHPDYNDDWKKNKTKDK